MSVATSSHQTYFGEIYNKHSLHIFGSTHKNDMLFDNFTKVNPYLGQKAPKNLVIIKKNILFLLVSK